MKVKKTNSRDMPIIMERNLDYTRQAMVKYQQSEKAAILPEGVAPEYIELLLWAMEQTDSPNPIVRERWWEYRS